MPQILIVSYSMTGTTWKAASMLAHHCNADRDTITPVVRHQGLLRSIWALWGALFERRPEIEPMRHDPGRYALVVLASPVWAGRIASPMRSYIAAYGERLPSVAFLCTQRASGAAQVFSRLAALCGKRPLATLALTERDVLEGRDQHRLIAFAGRLVEGAEEGRENDVAQGRMVGALH